MSTTPEKIIWTPQESVRHWTSVASSSDGLKLVAIASQPEEIYTSSNGGISWTLRASIPLLNSVASSSNGNKIVAVGTNSQIYITNNGGISWTPTETNRNWSSVASSSDGTKLVATVVEGQIYTSTDSGVSWTPRDVNRSWISVASSSDGTKLVAVVSNGMVYTSTDSGVSWTPRDANRAWSSVASSSDGTKLVAVASNDKIYTSADSGVSWTPRADNNNWKSVSSSGDGIRLVAAALYGRIYTSSDSGFSWIAREKNRGWYSVATSEDGTKIVALPWYDRIYIGTLLSQPVLPRRILVSVPKSSILDNNSLGVCFRVGGFDCCFTGSVARYSNTVCSTIPRIPEPPPLPCITMSDISQFKLKVSYDPQNCFSGHCCDFAVFLCYVNDILIGTANLNNKSTLGTNGEPICGPRSTLLILPENTKSINNTYKIELKKHPSLTRIHRGIARIELFNLEDDIVYSECIKDDVAHIITICP